MNLKDFDFSAIEIKDGYKTVTNRLVLWRQRDGTIHLRDPVTNRFFSSKTGDVIDPSIIVYE